MKRAKRVELQPPARSPATAARSAAVAYISRCEQAPRGTPCDAAVVGRRAEGKGDTLSGELRNSSANAAMNRRVAGPRDIDSANCQRAPALADCRLPNAGCGLFVAFNSVLHLYP
jgi:hypothetical protein